MEDNKKIKLVDLNTKAYRVTAVVLGIVILIYGGLFAIGVFDSEEIQEVVESEENNIICFMEKDPEGANMETKDGPLVDYRVVELEFIQNTNRVQGVYNFVPGMTEAQRGIFNGVLEADAKIQATYNFQTGDTEESVQHEFEIVENGLITEGHLLKQVSCSDAEFKYNIKTFFDN